jgi:hypothetical protein
MRRAGSLTIAQLLQENQAKPPLDLGFFACEKLSY